MIMSACIMENKCTNNSNKMFFYPEEDTDVSSIEGAWGTN